MGYNLGQLIYTSFPKSGFKVLASSRVPVPVQDAFVAEVAHTHWDAYNPPDLGYRAVYVYQVSPQDSLFGWVYNDGPDDLGRSHVPYFLCYYLAGSLLPHKLQEIFTCLDRGPGTLINRQEPPAVLEEEFSLDPDHYTPVRPGVTIPPVVQQQSRVSLARGELLHVFVPLTQPELLAPSLRRLHWSGLEDVRLSLEGGSPAQERIFALSYALNWGERGLDLVITALAQDPDWQVRYTAWNLLRAMTLPRALQAARGHTPWRPVGGGQGFLAAYERGVRDFTLAALAEAQLDYAQLRGVDLSRANLRGSNLRQAMLAGANLRRADLMGADLRGVDLTGANLIGVDLTGANLTAARLNGASLNWAKLQDTCLRQADLTQANLSGANAEGADLSHANLTQARLGLTNLGAANLQEANLQRANLVGADLGVANLDHALFVQAKLSKVNLLGASLVGTNLGGADLSGVDLALLNLSRVLWEAPRPPPAPPSASWWQKPWR
ncbi:pentapeptide repeat-containing protein [Anthocerotibacter panamensis]|uniref:pentapeptide repeat-containing protein n=1 Tax=Anthocerotibacter panamensis TaxID=2857077 RepID=UPI001C4024F9|nr:pentapeptide repeat-containing protein [Anthocerotibacter panamensis]